MRFQSAEKLILGHLDINLFRNKFDGIKFVTDNN